MTETTPSAQQDQISIDVRGVSKCYRLYDKPQHRLWQALLRGQKSFHRDFWALREVDLCVRRGEAVGIIGRNGAGKSTLLQMIAGTLSPSSGTIAVHGKVAALLQLGSGFNHDFSGRENVYMNGAILGFSHKEIDDRYAEIEAFADIGAFIDQPVKTYSSGMAMRLAFAVSAFLAPEVMIVDEALSVGDAAFQFKCRTRVEQLIASGTTLLFVSHDMGAVKSFCNRAVYLEHGSIKAQGPPDQIAEMYFRDVSADQIRSIVIPGAPKPAFSPETPGGGYGSNLAGFFSPSFASNNGTSALFQPGEAISFSFFCRFDDTVRNPHACVVVQTENLLRIGGHRIKIPTTHPTPRQYRCDVVIPNCLNPGTYFITIRLEDGIDLARRVLLHKTPGALTFTIPPQAMNSERLGFVDFGIRATCECILP